MADKHLRSKIYPSYATGISRIFHIILFSILPRSILAPLRIEIHLALVRFKSLFRRPAELPAKGSLLVNVGSGPYGRQGWMNIDGWKHPGVTLLHDCRRSLPLPDESAKGIIAEHFLEHIDYFEHVPVFLSECLRVLMRGGVLRVIVPDAEKYLCAYVYPNGGLMGQMRDERSMTKMEIINDVFRGGTWHHKYAYDYETLRKVLLESGFKTVERSAYGQSLLSDLAIDRQHHERESLYVEAVK